MKIGERIKYIRKKLNLSQVEFAKNLEISRTYLSYIEIEKNEPSKNMLYKLILIYNVSANWVLSGYGSPFLTDEINIQKSLNEQINLLKAENEKLKKELKKKI